jgi:hypothetical protein
MDDLTAIYFEVTSLENQLSIKKDEYLQAIKNGETLDELKKIFLEAKSLQEKLNLTKDIISTYRSLG